jgi:hypothetical protein
MLPKIPSFFLKTAKVISSRKERALQQKGNLSHRPYITQLRLRLRPREMVLIYLPPKKRSRDSSVDIATDYGLEDRVKFPAGAKICLFCIASTPALTSNGYGGLARRLKRPRCEAYHSLPSTAKVKNGGAILPLSHI